MQFNTQMIREVTRMLRILDRPGWAYWLAWGAVASVMLFGLAAFFNAIRWW